MFKIELDRVSKKFNKVWVFKNLNYTFTSDNFYAVVGPNGSGKSTLLQILSGFMPASKGTIVYRDQDSLLEVEKFYKHLSIATPYLELIEEFTLHEFLSFHFKFKNLSAGYTIEKIIDISGLKEAKDKFIKNFSSGMKQRVKLATVFFSESQIILLDEPTTNLDAKGVEWYDEMLKTINNKMVLIGSNLEREYRQCNTILNISDYK